MSSDCEDYEELDSFTEKMIARKQERERLLNEDIDDYEDLTPIKSIKSKSSLKSDNILVNDNQNNIKLNETETESQPIVVDSASKQVIENLSKLSPNRGRVPLSQRLNSIARTYNWDESENIDYIDDNDCDEEKQIQSRSPIKPIRQTAVTPLESPPKKRLLLNERLNQIARTYESSDDFEERQVSPTKTKSHNKVSAESESPTKRFIFQKTYGSEDTLQESKTSPLAKSPQKTMSSPQKKQINEKVSSQTIASNYIKTPEKVSPVKKPIESNKLKEKLTQFGFQKIEESVSPQKLIYNTKDNRKEFPVVNASSNVSVFRKQFEESSRPEVKADTPETLSLKAKKDLFERVISSENKAKAKQYLRKRNAQEVKPLANHIPDYNNKGVETKATTCDETAIKRQKSSPKMIETKTSVANNIFLRRQQLEAKLFGSETTTTTANAYKKEVEMRRNEIEALKRPLKPNDSEKQNNFDEDVPQNAFTKETSEGSAVDIHYQSVDDETAHQTVCEAFQEIEEYPNEQPEDDSFTDINYGLYSDKSQSKILIDKKLNIESESPTKTRLYPQLFAEPEELCTQSYDCEAFPPEKPPRVYQQIPEANTPTLRTISFYRREQTLKANECLASSTSDAIVLNTNVKQNENNIDLFERNRKIEEQIDEYNQKVEETNQMAGQASQALNLCLERDEFKSSTERVEAEKVLLLSGQKRIAFLNEIQRLKVKLKDRNPEPEATKGSLTLSDLKLQVKKDFLVAKAKGNVPEVHNVICLVYNGGNVIPSNLLNTENGIRNGHLEFSFGENTFSELSSDFKIVVHIFDLKTVINPMTHEIKYHIKRTPKKNKSMKSPTIRSPGGPNAVMSTSFRLIGAVTINLKNYSRNSFCLENFDFNSPFEGILLMSPKLTVCRHPFYKEGFFDVRDTKGFWNMRWVVLNGDQLSFWRFPDDALSKPALAVVDLKTCINPQIELIPSHLKHICLRRNTIAMIAVDNDILTEGGPLPRSHPIKLLMSGENKEDCIDWTKYLTTLLSNVRLWDSDAVKPYSEEEYEKLLMSLP